MQQKTSSKHWWYFSSISRQHVPAELRCFTFSPPPPAAFGLKAAQYKYYMSRVTKATKKMQWEVIQKRINSTDNLFSFLPLLRDLSLCHLFFSRSPSLLYFTKWIKTTDNLFSAPLLCFLSLAASLCLPSRCVQVYDWLKNNSYICVVCRVQ